MEPAGRARRAAPFARERPSLVWRGLGPARESATSPHRSIERAAGQGGAARGNGPQRGGRRGPPQDSQGQAGARTAFRSRGTGRRRRRWVRAERVQKPLGSRAEKPPGTGRAKDKPGPAHPFFFFPFSLFLPRRPVTRGQPVHTNLVAQNAYLRQNMNSARRPGRLSTHHAGVPEASHGHRRPHRSPSTPKEGERKGPGYLVDPRSP